MVRLKISVALRLVFESEESEHGLKVGPIFEEPQILSKTSTRRACKARKAPRGG